MKSTKEMLSIVKESTIDVEQYAAETINGAIGARVLSMYNQPISWVLDSELLPEIEAYLFGESIGIRGFAYGTEDDAELYNEFMKIYNPIYDRLRKYVQYESDEYRLNDYFGKIIDVEGCGGVRVIKNSPVPNAYAMKFSGYFAIAILQDHDKDNLTTSDFHTTHVSFNTLKELAMGLRYKHLCAQKSVIENLKTKRERGQLNEPQPYKFDWFMTEQEWDTSVNMVMFTTKERMYNLASYGKPHWRTLQIMDGDELNSRRNNMNLHVIAKDVSYDEARELYRKINDVTDVSRKLKYLNDEKVKLTSLLAEKNALIQDSTQMLSEFNLSLFSCLDNKAWGNDVKESVEYHLNDK